MKVFLWYQRPPREQWVLKVIHETGDKIATARTWFPEYSRSNVPPPSVTVPAVVTCARMVRAAIEGEEARYQVELRSSE